MVATRYFSSNPTLINNISPPPSRDRRNMSLKFCRKQFGNCSGLINFSFTLASGFARRAEIVEIGRAGSADPVRLVQGVAVAVDVCVRTTVGCERKEHSSSNHVVFVVNNSFEKLTAQFSTLARSGTRGARLPACVRFSDLPSGVRDVSPVHFFILIPVGAELFMLSRDQFSNV